VLNDGRILKADAVVLGTGYRSSWSNIFDQATRDDLGLGNVVRMEAAESKKYEWNYTTLANPTASPPRKPTLGLVSLSRPGARKEYSPKGLRC